MFVGGDFRIGFFASVEIPAQTELTFDYGNFDTLHTEDTRETAESETKKRKGTGAEDQQRSDENAQSPARLLAPIQTS